MYAPEVIYKKCPWWHKLLKKFKGVRLPVMPMLPTLDLEEIAKIQPLTDSVAAIFYLDEI